MSDERKEAQASLYALDALTGEELREFETALRSDLELQLLVAELRGTAGAFVAALPRVAPPPALKGKILAALDDRQRSAPAVLVADAEATPGWLTWLPWAMAACFAILCIVLISIGNTLRHQAFALRDQLEQRSEEASDIQRQFELLQNQAHQQTTNYQQRLLTIEKEVTKRLETIVRQNAALTNQLQQQNTEMRSQLARSLDQTQQLFRDKKALEEALAGVVNGNQDRLANIQGTLLRPTPESPPNAIAASVWSPQDQRGVLLVESLPSLPAAQAYQLWILDPKVPGPVSAGVLPASTTGSFRYPYTPSTRVETAERFAISIERKGGALAPTGRIVLVSN